MAGIDSFTKLMLHGEGADGSQTILDSEIVPKTVTAVGTFQIDTAQFKFGAASLLCGDGVDDYGYIEDSTDLAFGTGDFTIDCWIKRAETGTAQHNIFGQGNSVLSGGYHYGRIAPTTSTFIFAMNDDTYSPETLTGITDTNWHHIAVVRNGNNIAVSLDGVFGNNVDVTGITYTDSAARFAVGQLGEFVGGSSHNGWIDEFRISKGIARWTSNFTPPTAQYTRDSTLDLLDSISTSDTKATSRGVTLNLLDSISSSDSKTQRLAYGQTYLDSVFLTDLISMAKEYERNFIDGGPRYCSNGDIYSTEMDDITDWTDQDTGNGISSQATFDGKSCMKLDSGAIQAGTLAKRLQDIGTFSNRTVFSMKLYHDNIGTLSNLDQFYFTARNGTKRLNIYFASDGLFVFDGVTDNEVGTNLVQQATWQEWTFDWKGDTLDVYLNNTLVASDVDCSWNGSETNGESVFNQRGNNTANCITYIDWFKAGSDFAFGEGITLSDFIERVAKLSQAFPDAITLQDIFNRVLGGLRNFLDTTVMSDAIYKDLTKAYKDDVLLSDAISLLKKLTKLFEDSVTLTDRVQKGLSKEYNDVITLTDILSRVATLNVSPKDTITLNEKDFTITYTDRDIIEISADPQIQAGTHGQFLSLQYVTDYPKLRWVDGRGLKLFKGKNFTMNSGSIINFIYDSANQVWNETSRQQDIYVLDGEG